MSAYSPAAGRLQLQADRQAQSVKNRDAQVRGLASLLEMDGYDRTPFSERQLQSFHRQVQERQDKEKEAVDQDMASLHLIFSVYLTVVSSLTTQVWYLY